MKTQIMTGCRISDGQPIAVSVADGRIVSIHDAKHDDEAWVSAGFIDLQVNGYAGFDLNAKDGSTENLDPEVVLQLVHRLIQAGVTTWLPTLITASEASTIAALQAIAEARRRSEQVAYTLPAIHMEGPHISPEDGFRGAHPQQHVRPPDLDEFERWQNACGGLVGMVTLSPHYENTAHYVRSLVARGVHVAIGHTAASPQQIRIAVDAGARLSTHLGNGIAQQLPRHPNALWTQLADDRLTATLIADGQHLPADTLKAMIRAKGLARCVLVSDTVALAGMPPGSYVTPIGGRVELSSEGELRMAGSKLLAGSVTPLKDMLPRVMAMCGLSLGEALPMVTCNPGRFVGNRGWMRVGDAADLVRFRVNGNQQAVDILSVMVAGETFEGP